MLIDFSVTNYRSIKNTVTLSMRASGQDSFQKRNPENLIFSKIQNLGGPLIRSAMFYGANASGKSNLLDGLGAFASFVLTSLRNELDKNIDEYDPYLLDKDSKKKPTTFEINFVAQDNKRYFYKVVFDSKIIWEEELYFFPAGRMAKLFTRKHSVKTEFGDAFKGKKDFNLLDNQLLLSKTNGESIPVLNPVFRFFSSQLVPFTKQNLLYDEVLLANAKAIFSSDETDDLFFQKVILSIVKASDIGIENIYMKNEDVPKPNTTIGKWVERFKDMVSKNHLKSSHLVFEDGNQTGAIEFDISRNSTGSKKLLGIASIIVPSLRWGNVVIIDELDKSLHPALTRLLIHLFHNPETNPNNAQLIFSTHDISLMDREMLRRDQVFLVDKDREGHTSLRRLSDIPGISKVIPWQEWYMAGQFRAIPAINEYQIEHLLPAVQQN